MKTISTALTRPRSIVRRRERGDRRADVHADHVREAADRQRDERERERAATGRRRSCSRRRRATTTSSFRPARRAERPARQHDARRPARRRPGALRRTPSPTGPTSRIVAGEERQQRDGAAEQHRERDRARSRRAAPASGGRTAVPASRATSREPAISTRLLLDGPRPDRRDARRSPRAKRTTAGPVDGSGPIAKSNPPNAGPVTTVAWPTVERIASRARSAARAERGSAASSVRPDCRALRRRRSRTRARGTARASWRR